MKPSKLYTTMSKQAAGTVSTAMEPPIEGNPLDNELKDHTSNDVATQELSGSLKKESKDPVPNEVAVEDQAAKQDLSLNEEGGKNEQVDKLKGEDKANIQKMNGSGDGKRKLEQVTTEEKNESTKTQAEPGDGLSKKARKRQKRWEHKLAVKKRRKDHEREARRAKAVFEGRDLEAEKKDLEERTKSGEGRARREQKMLERIQSSADKSFKVCLDCSFEKEMTQKEINSLASQIRYCYAVNRRAPHPVYLSVTSLGGETKTVLDRIDGFPEGWVGRGFECHAESMEKVHNTSKLVYLTSDSPNVLEELDNDKVYIIGGIVDRNRLKRATIDRAEGLEIATAKLPITEHLNLFSTKVLTCNHVFEILLKYGDCGKDWKKAMLEVLPKRKDVQEK